MVVGTSISDEYAATAVVGVRRKSKDSMNRHIAFVSALRAKIASVNSSEMG